MDHQLPEPPPSPSTSPTSIAPHLLVLSPELAEEILAHLRNELPNEGVGLLAVTVEDQGEQRVATAEVFFPGRNRRQSPTRFDLDTRDLVAALSAIEDNGWQLGAIVHSHPLGPPTPSRTDLAEANYPESLMVIASFATAIPALRAWRLVPSGDTWTPEEVSIQSPG